MVSSSPEPAPILGQLGVQPEYLKIPGTGDFHRLIQRTRDLRLFLKNNEDQFWSPTTLK